MGLCNKYFHTHYAAFFRMHVAMHQVLSIYLFQLLLSYKLLPHLLPAGTLLKIKHVTINDIHILKIFLAFYYFKFILDVLIFGSKNFERLFRLLI